MKSKLKLLQKVIVNASLIRENLEGKREWQKNDRCKGEIGYVIGLRTLSNVKFKEKYNHDWECKEEPEPTDYFSFDVTKIIKAALVVFNLGKNPVYVDVEDLQIIQKED